MKKKLLNANDIKNEIEKLNRIENNNPCLEDIFNDYHVEAIEKFLEQKDLKIFLSRHKFYNYIDLYEPADIEEYIIERFEELGFKCYSKEDYLIVEVEG